MISHYTNTTLGTFLAQKENIRYNPLRKRS